MKGLIHKTALLLLPLLSVIMAASLSACSTVTSGNPSRSSIESIPSRVQRGTSTRDSVRSLVGEPKRKELYPTGERWLYGSASNSRTASGEAGNQLLSTGLGMIPYVGGAINSVRSVARAGSSQKPGATIDFDQRGVVQNYVVQVP